MISSFRSTTGLRAVFALALVLLYPVGEGLRGAGLRACPHHQVHEGHADAGARADAPNPHDASRHQHGSREGAGETLPCDCSSGLCSGAGMPFVAVESFAAGLASTTPLPAPLVERHETRRPYLLPYGNAPPATR